MQFASDVSTRMFCLINILQVTADKFYHCRYATLQCILYLINSGFFQFDGTIALDIPTTRCQFFKEGEKIWKG